MNRQMVIVAGAIALAGFLLLAGGWFFLLSPMNARIAAARSDLAGARSQLEDAKSKAKEYEKFQAEAENVRHQLDFYTSRLDSKFSYGDQVRIFGSLGKDLRLANLTWTPDKAHPSKEFPGMEEVDARFQFQSDYDSVGYFLNEANSQRRIIVPTDLILTSFDPTGRKSSLTASLTLQLYLSPGGKR